MQRHLFENLQKDVHSCQYKCREFRQASQHFLLFKPIFTKENVIRAALIYNIIYWGNVQDMVNVIGIIFLYSGHALPLLLNAVNSMVLSVLACKFHKHFIILTSV
jgi:hypothetical protein